MRSRIRSFAGAVLLFAAAAAFGMAASPGAAGTQSSKPSPFHQPPPPAAAEVTAGETAAEPSASRVARPAAARPQLAGKDSPDTGGILNLLDSFQLFGDRSTAADPAVPSAAPPPSAAESARVGSAPPPIMAPAPAQAAAVSSLSANMHGTMRLVVGKSLVIDSAARIQRVSIANAELAEAVAVSPRELLIHGKAPGETSLVLWQEGGRRQLYDLRIAASQIPEEDLRLQMESALEGEDIHFQIANDRVFLTGTVSDVVAARRAETIASTFGEPVNLLNVMVPEVEPQVLLKVRFANIDRTLAKELGFNLFNLGKGNTIGGVTTGQFSPLNWDTERGQASVSFSDALNIFLLRTDINLGATIRALQSNRILQILAEPNLLTINGKKASFLAGGEFPFPVLQGGANVGAVTISFREFGIRINFTPTLTSRGTIRLKVAPEVSSLDFANALLIQGFTIPAINTRKIDTEVELEPGQSFAIAGLLDQRAQEVFSKVPGIGDVPILGKLFQSRSKQKNDAELLVVVTPELVRPIREGEPVPQLRMPEEFLRDKAIGPRHPPLSQTGSVPLSASRRAIPYEQLREELKQQGQTMSPSDSGLAPPANGYPGTAPAAIGAPGSAPAASPVAAQGLPVSATTPAPR